jgi:hypothetical protein
MTPYEDGSMITNASGAMRKYLNARIGEAIPSSIIPSIAGARLALRTFAEDLEYLFEPLDLYLRLIAMLLESDLQLGRVGSLRHFRECCPWRD